MDKVKNPDPAGMSITDWGRKPARPLLGQGKLVAGLGLFIFGVGCLIAVFFPDSAHAVAEKPGQSFCLFLAFGIAAALILCAVGSMWLNCACWLALALISQAASLQMIEAGNLIHFQHYPPLSVLLNAHPLLMSVFAAQAVIVGGGVVNRFAALRRWLTLRFKIRTAVLLGAVFVISSAALSKNLTSYVAELSFATSVQLINLGNIILFALAIPESGSDVLERFKERLLATKTSAARKRRASQLVLMMGLGVSLMAATLSFFVYERHPHVPDEVLYVYQSLYLRQGSLTVPAPAAPEAFNVYMIPYRAERWYSPFPPGWPMLLALGQLINAAWLVNPLLGGLNIYLAYLFFKEIYALRTAVIAAGLLAVSPWSTFLAMSFMSHSLTLACALLGGIGVCYARRGNRPLLWSLVAGMAVGFLNLTRPLDGAVMAVLLGLWALGISGQRIAVKGIAAFVGGLAALGFVSLFYNWMITGNALTTPLQQYYEQYFGPKKFALGFGPDRGFDWPLDAMPGHSPLEAAINAVLNIFSLNIELFGWSIGSLLLIGIFIVLGRKERSDYVMLLCIAAIAMAYSLFWYHGGPDFGARYWFLMIVPLTALGARGIEYLERCLSRPQDASGQPNFRVPYAVAALCSLALICYLPWRATDKYYRYLNMRPDVADVARKFHFGQSLVLVRGAEHPDYESAWIENSIQSTAGAPLYAHDVNAKVRDEVLRAYPDRPIWILEGPSLTKDGYRVVGGPFSANELLSTGD